MNEYKAADGRLSINVDPAAKVEANNVFDKLGMTLTTGVNLYLKAVARNHGIPFSLTLDRADVLGEDVVQFENASKEFIAKEIADAKANGHPVALYDHELKKAYLEYPDGRRDYDFAK